MLLLKADGRAAALKAFGTTIQTEGRIPDFDKSVQVMLGGDEVFVATHPYYAKHAHEIIADLDAVGRAHLDPSYGKAQFADRPLDMRTGVANSSAKHWFGAASGPSFGPNSGADQRKNNQIAHDKAMRLAIEAHGLLKPLERTQRRIERLIDKLKANEKKKQLAPPYTEKLQALHLKELFARVKYMHAQPLSDAAFARLLRLLKEGDLKWAQATGLFDLVDFGRNEVDGKKLTDDAAKLEAVVRKDVGVDNIHVDPPPVTQLPKWLKKLLDDWADQDEKKPKHSK